MWQIKLHISTQDGSQKNDNSIKQMPSLTCKIFEKEMKFVTIDINIYLCTFSDYKDSCTLLALTLRKYLPTCVSFLGSYPENVDTPTSKLFNSVQCYSSYNFPVNKKIVSVFPIMPTVINSYILHITSRSWMNYLTSSFKLSIFGFSQIFVLKFMYSLSTSWFYLPIQFPSCSHTL